MRNWLGRALEHAGRAPDAACEIAVRIVDLDEGSELNRRYRNRDGATNVLSFPVGDEFDLPGEASQPLGDLVLCAPLVAREAAEQRKPAAAHWAHLLVHGTLHLLGFDHDEERAARDMEALEIEILAAAGLPDPYRGRETG